MFYQGEKTQAKDGNDTDLKLVADVEESQ